MAAILPRRSAYASIDTNTRRPEGLVCGELRPATGINSPQRGASITPPALRLRGPRRAQGAPRQGLAPQTPRAAPWRAFAHRAPAASATQPEGSGHGCDGGGGGQPLAVVHADATALPSPWIQFFKSKATGAWASRRLCPPGVSPCSGGGGQTPAPPAGERLSHLGWAAGLSTAKRATGQSASATRPGSRPPQNPPIL